MSRLLCSTCHRPEKACICRFITTVNNQTKVVILQHPSEVKQTKGTVALLSKSLKNCQVIEGENFTDNKVLASILSHYNVVLLYPSEHAKVLTAAVVNQQIREDKSDKPLCLLIIDGTWRKAYRMIMLSKNLQALPQVCLPESLASSGQYLIRKVAKNNALSSLEACCYALALIEKEYLNASEVKSDTGEFGKYTVLLNNFTQFNQFQLSFRPNKG
ncbi:MAG: DTW domain-containing protein [Colwellia sp.]